MIVVAIIAVLVAIAVPLFVNALNDAEDRVKEANERAVRAAAVEEILTKADLRKDGDADAQSWTIDALVDAGGNISQLIIKPSKTSIATDGLTCEDKNDDNQYPVKGAIKLLTYSAS